MSALYEGYWWWRAEFTEEPLPYKDEDMDGKFTQVAFSFGDKFRVTLTDLGNQRERFYRVVDLQTPQTQDLPQV